MTTPGWVYRCYDADGVLLYIGSTKKPEQRFANHKVQTPWWGDVAFTDVEWMPTIEDARAVESDAIAEEDAKYNRLGVKPTRRDVHGSYRRYRSGCRCAECRRGNARFQRQSTAERTARLTADASLAPHGRLSTYSNWGCRCAPCSEVNAAACRDYAKSRVVGEPAVTSDNGTGSPTHEEMGKAS